MVLPQNGYPLSVILSLSLSWIRGYMPLANFVTGFSLSRITEAVLLAAEFPFFILFRSNLIINAKYYIKEMIFVLRYLSKYLVYKKKILEFPF